MICSNIEEKTSNFFNWLRISTSHHFGGNFEKCFMPIYIFLLNNPTP